MWEVVDDHVIDKDGDYLTGASFSFGRSDGGKRNLYLVGLRIDPGSQVLMRLHDLVVFDVSKNFSETVIEKSIERSGSNNAVLTSFTQPPIVVVSHGDDDYIQNEDVLFLLYSHNRIDSGLLSLVQVNKVIDSDGNETIIVRDKRELIEFNTSIISFVVADIDGNGYRDCLVGLAGTNEVVVIKDCLLPLRLPAPSAFSSSSPAFNPLLVIFVSVGVVSFICLVVVVAVSLFYFYRFRSHINEKEKEKEKKKEFEMEDVDGEDDQQVVSNVANFCYCSSGSEDE